MTNEKNERGDKKMEITFTENTNKRERPANPPGFGTVFTNYMFEMDYTDEKGWHNAQIKPYGALTLDPSAMCLHYGQTIFEGAKAIERNGEVVLFRIYDNYKRMNLSAQRMMMPTIDVDFAVKATVELLKRDTGWFYDQPTSSIYIRPFIIATQQTLAAHAASAYKFMIILSPVASYFSGGEVRLVTETHYMRVAKTGTGEAKCGGNYGSSLLAANEAAAKGYSQVLWLDPIENRYVEEAGVMNVFFVIDNKVVTPVTDGSILKGITRDSVLQLAPDLGYESQEMKIDINDVVEWYKQGRVTEIFASGTAASIQPINSVTHLGQEMTFNYDENSACTKIAKRLEAIKDGTVEDTRHFTLRF